MASKRKPRIEGKEEGGNASGLIALVVVVILIGGVLFAMFSGGPGPSVVDEPELLDQTIDALKDVKKESFTFEGVIETDTPAGYIGMPFSGEGRVDTENERMNFKLNFDVASIDQPLTIETYTVDDQIYINFADVWDKYESGGILWQETQFSRKLMEFANAFDYTLGPTETVNGRNSYRADIKPTPEELIDLIETVGPGLMQNAGVVNPNELADMIKSVDMTVWVGVDDLLPVKTEIVMHTEARALNPAGPGVMTSDLLISITVNFDYKTPFNIVLPSAALRAIE